jgi:carbonic anhydrase
MLLLLPVGCTLDLVRERRLAAGGTHWVYAQLPSSEANIHDQRATWPAACSSGRHQSPINILSDAAVPSRKLDSGVQVHIRPHVPLLTNTGVYFELDRTTPEHFAFPIGEAAPHRTSEHKGWTSILGEKHLFYQVHWHAPSENRIDGTQFAMEAHYVHQLNDSRLVGTNSRLAVIAVMYALSDQCNAELDLFWEALPTTPGDAPFDTPLELTAWLEPLLADGFFHWEGSLTTPPCTEGVSWVLLRRTSHVCARQVQRLRASLATMRDGVDVNNRVVQPLHGRVVHVTTTAVGGAPLAPRAPAAQRGDCPSCGLREWVVLAVAVVGLWVLRVRVIGCVRSTHRPELLPSSSPASWSDPENPGAPVLRTPCTSHGREGDSAPPILV